MYTQMGLLRRMVKFLLACHVVCISGGMMSLCCCCCCYCSCWTESLTFVVASTRWRRPFHLQVRGGGGGGGGSRVLTACTSSTITSDEEYYGDYDADDDDDDADKKDDTKYSNNENNNDTILEVVGASGRMGSLFLPSGRAVPRGIAPGSLLGPNTPIVVAIPSPLWSSIHEICTRPDDLCFVGNGLFLEDFLEESTVVLPHYGILERHGPVVTSMTSPPTFIYGKKKHTVHLIRTMLEARGVLQVQEVDSWKMLQILGARKVLWASCMWLLCHDTKEQEQHPTIITATATAAAVASASTHVDRKTPLTLQQVHETKFEELKSLVQELLPYVVELVSSSSSPNSTTDSNDKDVWTIHNDLLSLDSILEYMTLYSMSMPHAIPSLALAKNEFKHRNGIFLAMEQQQQQQQQRHEQKRRMTNNSQPRPLSLHRQLLQRVLPNITIWDNDMSSPLLAAETPATTIHQGIGDDNDDHDNNCNNDDAQHVLWKHVSLPDANLVCIGRPTSQTTSPDSATVPFTKSVIIIGGGMLGSSIALQLARRNHSNNHNNNNNCHITVIDPTPHGTTSPASWAWINANQKTPHHYKLMNQLGMRAWRSDELLNDMVQWTGSLVSTANPLPQEGGYNMEGPLSLERVLELEPSVNFTENVMVYYFSEEGCVDPCEAVATMRKRAKELGVAFVNDTCVELIRDDGNRVNGVRLCHTIPEELHADVVICAAGTQAAALAGIPLVPSPGRISFARPSNMIQPSIDNDNSNVLQHILVDMIRESHVLQRKDGTIVAGGGGALQVGGNDNGGIGTKSSEHDATASVVVESKETARATTTGQGLELMTLAQTLVPHMKEKVTFSHSHDAVRPMPLDGLPIVGYTVPGLYTVVTHSGVTLAPFLGQLVAAEIWEDVSLDVLRPYRPTRFTT